MLEMYAPFDYWASGLLSWEDIVWVSNQHAYYCNPPYLPYLFMISLQESEQEMT